MQRLVLACAQSAVVALVKLGRSNLHRAFASSCKALGLPLIRVHDLWHLSLSLLAINGVPVKVAQARAGHSSPRRERGFANLNTFAAFDLNSARGYDAWYETAKGRQVAAAEEALLGDLLEQHPSVVTVLEVGCGTGHFARWFASRGLQVVGLDASQAMLTVGRDLDKGPHYLAGAAERLPFGDGSFDLAVLVTSLEFVSDPIEVLREAARVARYGLLLGVLNVASPLGLWRKLVAFFRPSPYQQAQFYTPRSLMRLVQLALPCHSRQIIWREALRPKWIPLPLHRIYRGAFIGVAVVLASDRDVERNTSGRQS